MNALLEPEIIYALYEASRAGVKIDLIVRGVCALRPGIPGLSENIRVRSVIGRFLEHNRIFHFRSSDQVFLSSADWMDRNFFRRIELCFPVLDAKLKQRVIAEGLKRYLDDNMQAWEMDADGRYRRLKPATTARCPQRAAGTARRTGREARAAAVGDGSASRAGDPVATEIELKLAIAPEDVGRLAKSALLAAATRSKPTTRTVYSVYYDTPEHDLAHRGMALRLRKVGGALGADVEDRRHGPGRIARTRRVRGSGRSAVAQLRGPDRHARRRAVRRCGIA